MEEFVREVLSRYTSFVSERQLYERWLDMRENSDVRDALVMTEMKITMIQSWFNLLNADERFVIEKRFTLYDIIKISRKISKNVVYLIWIVEISLNL